MHALEESNILLFLLQVFLLLAAARGLGLLLARYGQPAITAEILAGVILGPTLLGRFAPALHALLFPPDPTQYIMLESVAWVGILFFLLATGLETDASTAWRQRNNALVVSLSDIVIPMALAFVLALFLPSAYIPEGGGRLVFALFIAAIMTISALPVTARAMQELNIYRTDIGLMIICALTINDIIGWVIFAVILGSASGAGASYPQIAGVLFLTFAFLFLAFTIGRAVTDRVLHWFHRNNFPEPGSSLTFICLWGLLCGAATVWIGIHGLFGFFIAGIVAGESKALSENTRTVISEMVRAVLVPLFFASIGLTIDFFAQADLLLLTFMVVVGIAGRYIGAWVGVALTKSFQSSRGLISVCHVPGGEMQIVVSMIALEFGVISQPVFVAIVFSAVFTSIIVGPWLRRELTRSREMAVMPCFTRQGLVANLAADTRDDVIEELCKLAAKRHGALDADTLTQAVLEREEVMSTALEEGVAVPHARLPEIDQAIVVVGRLASGVDWNAADGKPARLVFLILTPNMDEQLQVLKAIATVMRDETQRERLLTAAHEDAMWRVIQDLFQHDTSVPTSEPARS